MGKVRGGTELRSQWGEGTGAEQRGQANGVQEINIIQQRFLGVIFYSSQVRVVA